MSVTVGTECFDEFLRKAAELGDTADSRLSPEELVELLCADCQFYHPDEEEQLECGAFKILSTLIREGTVTVDQIADVLRE